MSVAFTTTLQQMTRILLYLLAGFALNRLKLLPKGAGTGISKLATQLFLPALLLHSNMTEFNPADVGAYSQLVAMGGLLWALLTLPSFFIAKKLSGGRHPERGVYLYGLSFPNTGAVGMPLALALLGSAGLFQFNLFTLLFCIMTYAWGVGLFMDAGQKEKGNPVKTFLIKMFNPVFISMMIGLFLGAIGAKHWIPQLIIDFTGELGSFFAPVSLLMSGYTIADYPLGEVFSRPKSYLFTLLRLIVYPLVGLAAAHLLGADQFTAMLAVLAFAGPSGMNVVVFPASYGQDCRTGASNVLLSNLGSILTVPLLYALVQQFFI